MKLIFIILISILIGSYTTSFFSAFDTEYIRVRILDNDKCTAISYSLVTKNLKVTVSGDLIESENTSIALNSEATLYFLPKYNGENKHRYRVQAEYSDCESLLSEEREAERGRLIYEWIKGGKFKHHVRR